jgi:hypothetical protein
MMILNLARRAGIIAGTIATGIVIAAAVVITLLVISPWLIAEYLDDEDSGS